VRPSSSGIPTEPSRDKAPLGTKLGTATWGQIPACCQSHSRRQQLMPVPHPSSCGRGYTNICVASDHLRRTTRTIRTQALLQSDFERGNLQQSRQLRRWQDFRVSVQLNSLCGSETMIGSHTRSPNPTSIMVSSRDARSAERPQSSARAASPNAIVVAIAQNDCPGEPAAAVNFVKQQATRFQKWPVPTC